MSVKINKGSRLNYSNLIIADGVEFWQTPVLPNIPVSQRDSYYTVKLTDRLDSLAYKFYGNPNLWWVLANANGIDLIPTELYEGQVLRIPYPSDVLSRVVNLTPSL